MLTTSSTAPKFNASISLPIDADAAQSSTVVGQRLLAVGIILDASLAAVAVIVALAAGQKPDALFAEGSFITIVSALQMIAIACMCALIYQIRGEQRDAWGGSHLVWAIGALGMSILVFDEAAGLHEWLDARLHVIMGLQASPWTDRIDDLIVLGYGLAAASLAFVYRCELKVLWRIRRIFAIGAALFLAMVAADLLTNSYSSDPDLLDRRQGLALLAGLANALEETLKLCCQAVLFAGLAAAAILIKRDAPNGSARRNA